MTRYVSEAGRYRGQIVYYELKPSQPGKQTQALKIVAAIDDKWENQQWISLRERELEATGLLFLINSSGELNEAAARSLIENAGWSGKFEDFHSGKWEPSPCGFTVEATKGWKDNRVFFNIRYINPYVYSPKGGNNPADVQISPAEVEKLDARYGLALRAMRVNAQRAENSAVHQEGAVVANES